MITHEVNHTDTVITHTPQRQQMPSGAIRFGRSLRDPVEILREYWNTYQ